MGEYSGLGGSGKWSSSQAGFFYQDGVNAPWTVDATDENLLNVRSPAGAADKNHRSGGAETSGFAGDGQILQDFVQ